MPLGILLAEVTLSQFEDELKSMFLNPDVIASNLKLILAALERHDGRLSILLCQVFPSAAAKSRPSERIKAVNALYRAAVKGDPRVIYVI